MRAVAFRRSGARQVLSRSPRPLPFAAGPGELTRRATDALPATSRSHEPDRLRQVLERVDPRSPSRGHISASETSSAGRTLDDDSQLNKAAQRFVTNRLTRVLAVPTARDDLWPTSALDFVEPPFPALRILASRLLIGHVGDRRRANPTIMAFHGVAVEHHEYGLGSQLSVNPPLRILSSRDDAGESATYLLDFGEPFVQPGSRHESTAAKTRATMLSMASALGAFAAVRSVDST